MLLETHGQENTKHIIVQWQTKIFYILFFDGLKGVSAILCHTLPKQILFKLKVKLHSQNLYASVDSQE